MAGTVVCLFLGLLFGQMRDSVLVLGRCSMESVVALSAGRFLADAQSDQVLLVQKMGQVELIRSGERTRHRVDVLRLLLLRVQELGWEVFWRSGEMLGPEARALNLIPPVWTGGDVDGDSILEVITVPGDSCRFYHFTGQEVRLSTAFLPADAVRDAVWADVDLDGTGELLTLEVMADSGGERWAVRVWRKAMEQMVLLAGPIFLPDTGGVISFSLLGAARLEDYPGMPVIFAGDYPGLKPGVYGIVFAMGDSGFSVTTNPFPRREWFTKEMVLPAGRLQVFNAGDTLVAYGYFVPGSRPGGPPRSFAALQDGEWRLLPLRDSARLLSGPVCPFSYQGRSGWLELRGQVFYFYPGSPFLWR